MRIFLETERLILRYFTREDSHLLYELDRDPEVMRYINGGHPVELSYIQENFLPKLLKFYDYYEHYGIWATVEKSSGDFIGWFHLMPATDSNFAVELNLVSSEEMALGYRLRQASWGKGYAAEGSRMLMKKGFGEWGVKRIVAWALVANKPSIRVMEKVGLKFEREFGFEPHQLPNFPEPEERKAVKYGCDREEFLEECIGD